MGVWIAIQRFFRDAKITEYYVKISKEEFQGNLKRASDVCEVARKFVEGSDMVEEVKQRNLTKILAWQQDLERKLSLADPREVARERRRFF